MGQQDCGLCRGTFDEQDVARGRRLSICRACVRAGVAATLEGAAGSIERATPRSYLPCAMCGDQTPPSSLFAPGGLDEAAVCATCIRESYASLSRLVDLARNRYAHFPDGSDRSSRELLAALPNEAGRVAQSVAERGRDSTSVEAADIEQALREMLYEGGSLNASLLGVQGNGEPPRS